MINKYDTKEIKLNADLAQFKKDSVIKIQVDENGIPIDRYWRDRQRDAAIDDCIQFKGEKKESIKYKESEKVKLKTSK